MFRLLFVTFLGEYRGDAHVHTGGPRAWIMNVPVAILVLPTVAVGGALCSAATHRRGRISSRRSLRRRSTSRASGKPAPALSENVTALIVLAVVAIGIRDRLAALCDRRRAARCRRAARTRGGAHAGVLTNLFYFDAVIDALFVRPAQSLGRFFGRVVDPHVIDGAVRELVFIARWLGHARALASKPAWCARTR